MLSVGLCRALLYILEMVNGNESMLGLRGLFCGFSFVDGRKEYRCRCQQLLHLFCTSQNETSLEWPQAPNPIYLPHLLQHYGDKLPAYLVSKFYVTF
jgi:hypothetical protein